VANVLMKRKALRINWRQLSRYGQVNQPGDSAIRLSQKDFYALVEALEKSAPQIPKKLEERLGRPSPFIEALNINDPAVNRDR
jgi:hypothetical protein